MRYLPQLQALCYCLFFLWIMQLMLGEGSASPQEGQPAVK